MNPFPTITLEQWQTLVTVASESSLTEAATQLNKSPSTLSYSLRRLNDALPEPAIQLQGRKLALTALGTALLHRAERLVKDANEIESLAQELAQGKSSLVIGYEGLFPQSVLRLVLDDISHTYPSIQLKLIEEVLSGIDELLFAAQADFILTPRVPPGYLSEKVLDCEIIAVAHHQHPIHQLTELITDQQLSQFRQVVVSDSGLKRQQDAGWLGSHQRWTVDSFSKSLDIVLAGQGFAWLPADRIKPLLIQGVLKSIPLARESKRVMPMYLIDGLFMEQHPMLAEVRGMIITRCKESSLGRHHMLS